MPIKKIHIITQAALGVVNMGECNTLNGMNQFLQLNVTDLYNAKTDEEINSIILDKLNEDSTSTKNALKPHHNKNNQHHVAYSTSNTGRFKTYENDGGAGITIEQKIFTTEFEPVRSEFLSFGEFKIIVMDENVEQYDVLELGGRNRICINELLNKFGEMGAEEVYLIDLSCSVYKDIDRDTVISPGNVIDKYNIPEITGKLSAGSKNNKTKKRKHLKPKKTKKRKHLKTKKEKRKQSIRKR